MTLVERTHNLPEPLRNLTERERWKTNFWLISFWKDLLYSFLYNKSFFIVKTEKREGWEHEQREERKAAFYESLQAVVHILKFMGECTYEDIDFDPTDSFDPVAHKNG